MQRYRCSVLSSRAGALGSLSARLKERGGRRRGLYCRPLAAVIVVLFTPLLPVFPQPTQVGTGVISGAVYCADTNEPARFVAVKVQSVSSLGSAPKVLEQGPADAVSTTTGVDGAFRVDGLVPGEYLVLASLQGYMYPLARLTYSDLDGDSDSSSARVGERVAALLPHVAVTVGQTSSITIRLERGAEFSGTVSFDDGAPVIGAQIRLYRSSKSGDKWSEALQPPNAGWLQMTTDDLGRFRVPGLPSGKYLVSARFPVNGGSGNAILGGAVRTSSGVPYQSQLEVYFGDTVRQRDATMLNLAEGERRSGIDIHLPLAKLHTLSGTVRAASDGRPLRSAFMQLRFSDDVRPFLRAHGGDDGTFLIPFVPDGEYILSVSAPPEKDRKFKDRDLPISVHGDTNEMDVALPDTPIEPR